MGLKHEQTLEHFREALAELDARSLPAPLRSRLAELWLERAQNEHASVASFDRFCLGLLAVGAPPELLESAHHAALDEVLHARLCFAIASVYAREPMGPGPLPLAGALAADFDLTALAVSTALEGCLGETLSALEAERCAELAQPPAVKTALEIIAKDEAAHAELAWAFLRFACEVGGEEATRAVRESFGPALRASAATATKYACADPEVNGFGFLDPEQAVRVRQQALAEVLIPAAKALGLA
ncbi:MAG: hypothetical protein KC766_12345 [Myxococcales bacterium]|nr:hypothetical protein [Myxococcales bacterium]